MINRLRDGSRRDAHISKWPEIENLAGHSSPRRLRAVERGMLRKDPAVAAAQAIRSLMALDQAKQCLR